MIVAREMAPKQLCFISRIGAWEYTPRRTYKALTFREFASLSWQQTCGGGVVAHLG